MEIKEIKPSKEEIDELIYLSILWEKEDITFGYRKNDINDIIDKRVFVAKESNKIIGYIFAKEGIAKNHGSIMPDGKLYFGIEEIYVIKEKRSYGIGKQLMEYVKNIAKEENYKYIFLTTSTKDSNKILYFYINKCDMTFYCAHLVEKI